MYRIRFFIEDCIYDAVDFLLTPLRIILEFLEQKKKWRVKVKVGFDKTFFFYKNALRYSKTMPHSKIIKIKKVKE